MDIHPSVVQNSSNSDKANSSEGLGGIDLEQYLDLSDNFEFESGRSPTVKGNLRKHLTFWKSISAPQYILQVIEYGYVIPFVEIPPSSYSRNNFSALKHGEFVSDAIQQLLQSGSIVELLQLRIFSLSV